MTDAAFREALDMCLEMHANYGSVSVPALTAARARVLALYAERDEALAYANDLCRSAFQIASRQGRDTNWSGFANRLMEALAQQHRLMYANDPSLLDQAEPYRVKEARDGK